MDLGLGGRGYLLTGASRGLGLAAAQALVDDGARVVLSSRSQESVDRSAEELGGAPAAYGVVADLADAGAVERLVAEAHDRLGIRVFGLMPGRIATDRTMDVDAASGDPEAARRTAESAIPLRRYGTPEEFGRVAAFVLSPAASYLT